MKDISTQEALDEIGKKIASCKKCPLYRMRIKAVPGSGTARSGIVFIGEGPGAQEDKIGMPFVGSAGKFLDEMLADIKMNRDDVFITNIVKCRPPNNRDPLPDEVSICTETYLWNQIEIINPKVIITLGRHAMYRFIPKDKKIGEVHGMLFHLTSPKSGKTFNILPLYHPAAALYNGGLREVLKEDFSRIPKLLEIIKIDKKMPQRRM